MEKIVLITKKNGAIVSHKMSNMDSIMIDAFVKNCWPEAIGWDVQKNASDYFPRIN